jgi:hypothetical protein
MWIARLCCTALPAPGALLHMFADKGSRQRKQTAPLVMLRLTPPPPHPLIHIRAPTHTHGCIQIFVTDPPVAYMLFFFYQTVENTHFNQYLQENILQ